MSLPSKAALVLVGNELTEGRRSDLHGAWLAEKLSRIGCKVGEIVIIPDNLDEYITTLRRLCARMTLVICCGGLGSTVDELSHAALYAFAHRNIPSAEHLPKGFHAIPNDYGSAEGIWGYYRRTLLIWLPGPPSELRPMVDKYVMALLTERYSMHSEPRVLCSLYDVKESHADSIVYAFSQEHAEYGNLRWSTRICSYRIELILSGCSREIMLRCVLYLRVKLGRCRVALGAEEIAAHVLSLLRCQERHAAVVESCTGGQISALITEYDRASESFWGATVAYQNDAKVAYGIESASLARHGAVSQPVTQEMASAALGKGGKKVYVALAVTGIIGSELKQYPQIKRGSGWIALADHRGYGASRFLQFSPRLSRRILQQRFSVAAFVFLWEYLRGK